MTQRERYVMVEAQLEPRLVGGRAAQRHRNVGNRRRSRSRRGLRVHLAPQGITGTNYLELDYVDTLPRARAADRLGSPTNIYIPSTPSTVTTFVNAASGDRRSPSPPRHRDDACKSQQAADDCDRSRGEPRYDRHLEGRVRHREARRQDTRQDRVDARRRRGEEAVGRGRRIARRAAPDEQRS